MAYAFRCKNCGHLEPAAHAGECALPHACSVCGAGVTFGPEKKKVEELLQGFADKTPAETAEALMKLMANPDKKAQPDNWEVLHDAQDARLTELGLTRADVVKHTPAPPSGNRPPQVLVRDAGDAAQTVDQTAKA